ncbi:MAG: anhydro-N-acetylmuramic acid kinase [Bernardetiaceae bacterium]|nr:anhydro-N-acetylmuramic acid kinase [Bernardetiaceae bacterium]
MQEHFTVLGMMSGTSLDGVDLALVEFWQNEKWYFRLHAAETVPYTQQWQELLGNLENQSAFEYARIDVELGRYFGLLAKDFIARRQIKPLFIASHGHTIFHQPEIGLTTQIGCGATLAATSGYPVVCNFRKLDVALKGQGAPLVPIGDQILFSQYEFCLNLGGIANFSTDYQGRRISYDVTFNNLIFNYLSQKLGKPYDESGNLARSGQIQTDLLDLFQRDPYLQKPFPKSLGKEQFIAYYLPIIEKSNAKIEDLLCTAVYFVAGEIAKNIKWFNRSNAKVLLTGGGAFNQFLVELLQQLLPETKIVVPEPEIISFKEAIVFAFLGLLRYLEKNNVLSSVTGASMDSCSGVIWKV